MSLILIKKVASNIKVYAPNNELGTYLVVIGNDVYEMSDDGYMPNGVNSYLGDASGFDFSRTGLLSNMHMIGENDISEGLHRTIENRLNQGKEYHE